MRRESDCRSRSQGSGWLAPHNKNIIYNVIPGTAARSIEKNFYHANIISKFSEVQLPYFPTRTLSREELDSFSDALIECYSCLRFTTPYPRNLGVKNSKITLPVVGPDVIEGANGPGDAPGGDPILDNDVSSDATSKVQKCFLHDKPRSNCDRCKAFVAWKQSSKRARLE
jgi:hypothetical protein